MNIFKTCLCILGSLIGLFLIYGLYYAENAYDNEEIRKPWYEVVEAQVEKYPELREFVLVRFKDNKITRSEYSDIMVESSRIHQKNAAAAGDQYKTVFKKKLSKP